MNFLFMLLSLFTFREHPGCLEMDIILLGDVSASVKGHENFVADAFQEFTDKTDLSETGIRIGVVAFSDNPMILAPLTANKARITNGINFIRGYKQGQSTNMTKALELAVDELSNGRNAKKMIILVSDGEANDEGDVLQLVTEIRKLDDFYICGVLVLGHFQRPDIMGMISDPFCYVSSSYEMLPAIFRTLDVCF